MNQRSLILLAALAGGLMTVNAMTPEDWFAQGVQADRAGQFSEAAQAFENSNRQRPAPGTLVNLGRAEWQCGKAGRAILHWEQAQWLDPSDERAAANLRFARLAVQVDPPQFQWFEVASTWLPDNDWVWMAGFSLWLAVGLVVLPGVFRRPKAGWHHAVSALALCVFLFSLTANVGVITRCRLGFLLPKETPLRLTPTQGAETVTVLPAGTPARKVRVHGNYIYIRTTETAGWVEREQFDLICPE